MENALEIHGLGKKYPGFSLQQIDLTLPRGYIMGLIGPNGAGKTTLIKLILNLLKKDGGEIRVFGLDHVSAETEIKSRTGFVHETSQFWEFLTLARIRAIVAPFYASWDDACFRKLMKEFQLPPDQKYGTLSRGMKTKFALVLALSHDADLLILDEPTSGLDPVFRREFLDRLAGILQNEGKTILFSTHITSDLERIADYITLLQNGRIVYSGEKDDIRENWGLVKGGLELLTPAVEAMFLSCRRGSYGFEALTRDIPGIRERFGSAVLVEHPSLEDLVYFTSGAGRSAPAAAAAKSGRG